MKKYFVYQLKKCLAPFLIILFAGAILYVFPLQIEGSSRFYYTILDYLGYLMLVLGVACALMPVWLFSYKMDKRSTDLFYSLPMTKTKQLAVRYITGFIAIIAAYTIVYILGFIVMVLRYAATENAPEYIYYVWLYFSSIIPAYIIYSISSFAFMRANSTFDGVIFIIFSMTALFMVTLFISEFAKYQQTKIYGDDVAITTTQTYVKYGLYFPFTPLNEITCFFQDMIWGYDYSYSNPFSDMSDPEAINMLISFIVYPIISAACTWGLFYTEKYSKAENCNQVSQSVFGYKVMLPLYVFITCTIMGVTWIQSDLILFLIIAAIAYVFAALYKKSFKIGWKFAVVLIVCAVAGIIVGTLTGGLL